MTDDSRFDPTVPRRGAGRRQPRPSDKLKAAAEQDGHEATVRSARPLPARAPGRQTGSGRLAVSGEATQPRGSGRSRGAAPPAGPEERQGRFVLHEELGRGGMGTVRLAEDTELGRDLAIKFLLAPDAHAAEQFLEEAQITAQLEHPNIVPTHELGRDTTRPNVGGNEADCRPKPGRSD